MKPLRSIVSITLFIWVAVNLKGQVKSETLTFETGKTYKVDLRDGSQFIGEFVMQDSISIVLTNNTIPEIRIPVCHIKKAEEIDVSGIQEGKHWFPNPNSTRYLFSPSAFNLKRGEGYYQNTYLIFNSFNVGLTDHFSVGGGFEILTTFGSLTSGSFKPIYFITPKVGFPVNNRFSLGGGLMYVSVPIDMYDESGNNRSAFGAVYGVGTIGNYDKNVTLGLGWGFNEGNLADKPLITLSGMSRIGRKTALVTENWFIPGDTYYAMFSYGIRFFGEKLAVDLAFLNNGYIAKILVIGVPYVDFVVKF